MTPRLLAREDGVDIDFARLRAARRDRLLGAMASHELDALVLGRPANVRYASGARQLWTAGIRPFSPACVVVAATGQVHLLSVWDEGVPDEIPHQNLFGLTWNPAGLVRSLVAIPGVTAGARVGVDALSPAFAELLPWTLADAGAVVHEARSAKAGDEIACIATATAVAEAGLAAMVDALSGTVTERELLAVLAERVARLGVPILAGEGVACATPRQGPVRPSQLLSDQAIEPGQLVVLNPGVLYAGYEGGLGRTWPAGAGPDLTGPLESLARRCRAALEALVEQCRAGHTGADLHRAWKASGEAPPPTSVALAHGIGLGAEPPLVGTGYGSGARLLAGMVLAVQSWVTAEGVGGYFERDLVVVQDGPPQRLTGHPL